MDDKQFGDPFTGERPVLDGGRQPGEYAQSSTPDEKVYGRPEDDAVVRKRQEEIEGILDERERAVNQEEKTLFVWKSPARPFKERNREYYTTIGAIVILLSIILLFAREFLLVAVIVSFAFVSYVLASVKPEEVEHEITTRGIRTGGRFFRWSVLGRFWFSEKFGQRMVSIETAMAFPGQLLMLIGHQDEARVKEILRKYLLHETPEPTFLDNASSWLSKKVPLESG